MIHKRKSTVKELQSLCGFLNFIGKAVFPGRTFTRQMYSKYSTVMYLPGGQVEKFKGWEIDALGNRTQKFKLKPHHHVRLDTEFKSDCQIWLEFLTGQLAQVVSRPTGRFNGFNCNFTRHQVLLRCKCRGTIGIWKSSEHFMDPGILGTRVHPIKETKY